MLRRSLAHAAGAAVIASSLLVPVSPQESRPDVEFAPVGRLIDLGGRRLHQVCSGEGSPAVVIENGAGGFSLDWVRVQSEVAKITKVCSYDRAGYAWSDSGPTQDTVEQTIDDLHLLLRKTVRPTYVLVGASLGAIYARAYQRRFPEQVVGMVLVDGTHDEAITFMSAGKRVPISMLSAEELRVAYAQYEKEAPRPSAGRPDQEPLNRLSAELQRVRYWAFEKLIRDVGLLPKGGAAAESWRQEFTALRRQRLGETHPLGDLPLSVLERSNDVDSTWHAQQVELAALSAVGKHLKVDDSGHMIQLYRPDAVAAAIRGVVLAVRRQKH